MASIKDIHFIFTLSITDAEFQLILQALRQKLTYQDRGDANELAKQLEAIRAKVAERLNSSRR